MRYLPVSQFRDKIKLVAEGRVEVRSAVTEFRFVIFFQDHKTLQGSTPPSLLFDSIRFKSPCPF